MPSYGWESQVVEHYKSQSKPFPPASEQVRADWQIEIWRGGRGHWNLKASPVLRPRAYYTITGGHIPAAAPFEEVLIRQLRRCARQGVFGADRILRGGWSGPVPDAALDAAYRILAAWLETPDGQEAEEMLERVKETEKKAAEHAARR